MREKASRKGQQGNSLQAADLEQDEEEQDIMLMKDTNKFVIKDLEETENKKQKENELKRKRKEVMGYGKGEEMESSDEEAIMKNEKGQRDIGKLATRVRE